MIEEAVLIGASTALVGVVTTPLVPGSSQQPVGVLLLNAGLVHRPGPGRIYVKLARTLATLGFVSLRFDFAGIGDSPARSDTLSYEKCVIAETREAMDHLERTRGITQFVLMGGCSGAVGSFETAACDSRVVGAILINFQFPEVDEDASNSERSARNAAHYYQSVALSSLRSWQRLLTGKSNYAQLMRALRNAIVRKFVSRETVSGISDFQMKLCELADRDVRVVFLYSAEDPGLEELRAFAGRQLKQLGAKGYAPIEVIRGADHTFSTHLDQERLIQAVCKRTNTIALAVERPSRVVRPQDVAVTPFLGRVAAEEELPR